VLTKDFDDESLQEFIKEGAVRRDLIQHLTDGTYDIVQEEIRSMEMLDLAGELDSLSTVDKYKIAVKRLSAANSAKAQKSVQDAAQANQKLELDRINAEKARAEAEEFKKKAAEKERLATEARNKAASVSKKRVVKQKAESVKPESLKGDDFKNYFRDMMMS